MRATLAINAGEHRTPLGQQLARTHAAGADGWGLDHDGFIGRLPLPNKTAGSWAEFYAVRRVLPYLKLARDRGAITDPDAAAVEAVVGRLTGREIANVKLVYRYNAISLGRWDGILQLIDGAGHPKPKYVGGRKAVRIKAGIQRGALWGTAHPTFGRPRRRRRLAAAPDAIAEQAAVSAGKPAL